MYFFMIVYLLLVLIRPQDYPALAGTNLPYQQAALIVAALFWLLSKRKSFDAPQYPLLLAFFVVLMVSKAVNGWAGGALYVAALFVPVGLSFLLLANAAYSRERVLNVMAVFALCACVLSLHGIEQATTGVGWTGIKLSQETRIQYVGIFNDPNDLGLLFVTCLPMALYLGARGGLLGLRRLFWWGVAGVLVYGIYLTDSRGTLLALLVLLGLYVWRWRGMFTAGALGAAAVAGMLALPSRLQEVDVSEESAAGRVESWYEGLQMFISHPVFGVGAGNYSDYNPLTAHNSFMLVLAETGFVGFFLWMAFVGYCFWMMYTVLRRDDEAFVAAEGEAFGGDDGVDESLLQEWRLDRGIAFTLFLSLCGFFACAFFLSRSYVVTLYLLAALVIAHYVGMRGRYPWLPKFSLINDSPRWLAVAVGGVIALFVIVKVLLAMS
jgi:putative inorganic carbon (HCO3(-)) transporter